MDETDLSLDIESLDLEQSDIEYYNHSTLTSTDEIKAWLKSVNITNYEIHEDLTVSVDDHVFFYMMGIQNIPIQFHTIKGDLFVGGNNLQSLKGFPIILEGMLTIAGEAIESLEYLPQKLEGPIKLYNNQKLHDLRSNLKFCNSIIESSTFFESINYLSFEEGLDLYTYQAKDYINWLKNLDTFMHDTNKFEI